MPEIRNYTRQNLPNRTLQAGATPAAFGANTAGIESLAAATQQVGNALTNAGEQIQQIQKRRDESEYYNALSQFQLENVKTQRDLSMREYEDESKISEAYIEDLNIRAQNVKIPSSMKAQWERDIAGMRINFAESGLREQARRAGVRAETNWNSTVISASNLAALDPSRQSEAEAIIRAASMSLPVPSADREAVTQEAILKIKQSVVSAQSSSSPADFIRQAQSGKYNDVPNLQSYVERAQNEIESQNRKAMAIKQSELKATIEDRIAEAQSTGSSLPLPEAEIRSAYDPSDAEKIISDYNRALSFGQKYKEIATATPERIREIISQAVPSGDGFKDEQAEYNDFLRAIEYRNKQIAQDPSNYVISQVPEVNAAYSAYSETLAAAQQQQDAGVREAMLEKSRSQLNFAVETNLKKQSELGVPIYAQTVLGKEGALTIKNELMTQKPLDRINQIDEMRENYGKHWPIVKQELKAAGINSNLAVLLDMDDPSQADARAKLAEAETIENLDKFFSKEIQTEIQDSVASEMAEYGPAYGPQLGGLDALSNYNTAVQTLSKMYVAMDKLSPSDAVKKAKNDIIGNYKIPIGRTLVPSKYDTSLVQSGMEAALNLIQKNNEIAAPVLSAYPEDITEEQYRRELSIGGYFATSPTGDGVILYDQLHYPVFKKDGTMFEIKFDQLQDLGREITEQPNMRVKGIGVFG